MLGVFRIRIRLDSFNFGQPAPDPGSKNQTNSWKISTKINLNHLNIIHFFQNYLLCLLTEKLWTACPNVVILDLRNL